MSVDAVRFRTLLFNINVIQNSVIVISLSMYFLWGYLGPSCLVGLAVLGVMMLLLTFIMTRVKRNYAKLMVARDRRMKIISEAIDGIKVIKFNAWEKSFSERIREVRDEEIGRLRINRFFGTTMNTSTQFVPFLMAAGSFACYVLTDPTHVLTAEKAFVSISYFNLLRTPLAWLPGFITELAQVAVSMERINSYLGAGELNPNDVKKEDKCEGKPSVDIDDNAKFSWDSSLPPTLGLPRISLDSGKLIAIIGQVGAGKSSLLASVVGEMEKKEGSVTLRGRVAYAPQVPFIKNATLRDNITFGLPFDQDKYDNVLEACALLPDLATLDAGDMTEIGEKGINLSGGQKHRVSLARAVYSDRDVYLLDDPLSAVDAHVGKHIFARVLHSETGILKGKTRILVTHSMTHLPDMDLILVMKEGEVIHCSTYQGLNNMSRDSPDWHFINEYCLTREGDEQVDDEGIEDEEVSDEAEPLLNNDNNDPSNNNNNDTNANANANNSTDGTRNNGSGLTSAEEVETKSVGRNVYWYYLKVLGGFAISSVFFHTISQSLAVGANLWLAHWSNDNQTSTGKQDKYLGVYVAFGLGSCLTFSVGWLSTLLGGLWASTVLHARMLFRILRAPMSFFDTTPKGRLINRFSSDIADVDQLIPQSCNNIVRFSLRLLAIFVVICITSYYFIFVMIPVAAAYWAIQTFFMATGRQIRRILSIRRSPIYSHFAETLSGAATIRAYDLEETFKQACRDKVDRIVSAFMVLNNACRWNSVRLEIVGNFVILSAALFAVLERDNLSSGIVGLSLTYALQVSGVLYSLLMTMTQMEQQMVAVERIKEYDESIPQEAASEIPEEDPPPEWPEYGEIQYVNYSTRYRPGLGLVLKDINCNIGQGEKIGVVGRTGAGKSSLASSLFRLIEPASGTIIIDGYDISKIGLESLRSKLTMIPQDPVLYSGTLRSNLDPFGEKNDDEIYDVIKMTHLDRLFLRNQSEDQGLDQPIGEQGGNLSVGQRQLVCLARALLRECRVLVLDEATASVDPRTDALVQETIRRGFRRCTVLTIAHRLGTIMDSDRVMVLEEGKLVELDTPQNLLQRPDSKFRFFASEANLL